MRIGPLQAFGFGFALGFIVGLAFGGLVSLFFGVATGLAVAVAFGVVMGILSLVLFYVWRAIPRKAQLLVVILLLVMGLVAVQPELDVLALVGLLFTFLGVGKGR